MKKTILISLVLLAGAMQGIIWAGVSNDFLIVCTMAILCGLAVGLAGGWLVTRICDG